MAGGRIITAEAVIKGKDETGAAFQSVESRVENLRRKLGMFRRAADIKDQVNATNAALERQQRVLAAIEKTRQAELRLDAAHTRYRDAMAKADKATAAYAAADRANQAKALALMDRANAAAGKMEAAWRRQLDAVGALRQGLEAEGIATNDLAAAEARLRTGIEATSRAMLGQREALQLVAAAEHRAMEGRRRASEVGHHLLGGAAGMAAGMGGGYMAAQAVEHVAHQGAEYQHEIVRMQAAGMSPPEIAEAQDAAQKLSEKHRTASPVDILHLLRNARSTVGSYEEAAQVIDPLLSLRTVALGAHPDKSTELEGDFDKLVKGMEIKGVTQNLPKFRHYMDNMAKAMDVFGDTLRPTDYYQMFKYGRQSTNATSDDFMLSVAPTLAQELGGSSAGKALENVYQHLVGGHMEHTAIQDLDQFGLIDRRKVVRTKTGAIKGLLPGGVLGTDMPGGWDFYKWVNERWLPAVNRYLDKHHITNPAQREAFIQQHAATDAGTGTAGQPWSIFATQQQRIEKDRALIKGAHGLDAAEQFQSKDPLVAWKAVTTQLANLAQAASSPGMEQAAGVLNSVAGGLARLAAAAKEHPEAALLGLGGTAGAAAGIGRWALRGLFAAGPALSSAAVELSGAAKALTASAAGNPFRQAAKDAGVLGAGGALRGALATTGMIGLGIAAGSEGGDMIADPDGYKRSMSDAWAGWKGLWHHEFDAPTHAPEPPAEHSRFGGGFGMSEISGLVGDLKALTPAQVDVTGKLDPVELKGAADVRVSVQVKGGEVTDTHASSSGNIKASVGTTMMDAAAVGGVW